MNVSSSSQPTIFRDIITVIHSGHSSRQELLDALDVLRPSAIVTHSNKDLNLLRERGLPAHVLAARCPARIAATERRMQANVRAAQDDAMALPANPAPLSPPQAGRPSTSAEPTTLPSAPKAPMSPSLEGASPEANHKLSSSEVLCDTAQSQSILIADKVRLGSELYGFIIDGNAEGM